MALKQTYENVSEKLEKTVNPRCNGIRNIQIISMIAFKLSLKNYKTMNY